MINNYLFIGGIKMEFLESNLELQSPIKHILSKMTKAEAYCFGGASPPSPKRRAERDRTETKSRAENNL